MSYNIINFKFQHDSLFPKMQNKLHFVNRHNLDKLTQFVARLKVLDYKIKHFEIFFLYDLF